MRGLRTAHMKLLKIHWRKAISVCNIGTGRVLKRYRTYGKRNILDRAIQPAQEAFVERSDLAISCNF